MNKQSSEFSRMLELYEEGLIDKETFSNRMEQLSNSIAENQQTIHKLEAELSLNKQVQLVPEEFIKNTLSNLGYLLRTATREQQKILLNLVIDKVLVTKDKCIDKIDIRLDDKIHEFLNRQREGSSNDEEPSSFVFRFSI